MIEGERSWTFLSNHGHVLVAVAQDPDARLRDVAQRVGVTERAVQIILRDLEEAGYVRKRRLGRRNSYAIVGGTRFRHPLEATVGVAQFLDLVTAGPGRPPAADGLTAAGPLTQEVDFVR